MDSVPSDAQELSAASNERGAAFPLEVLQLLLPLLPLEDDAHDSARERLTR